MYTPILKFKQGELKALEHVSDSDSLIRPLVEILGDLSADQQLDAFVDATCRKLVRAWPPGRGRILVDVDYVDPSAGTDDDSPTLLPRLLDAMHASGILATPVVRLGSVEGVAPNLAARRDPDLGASIRVTSEDLDDTVVPLPELLDRVVDLLGLSPGSVDLILDFGAIEDEGAQSLAARLARFILPTLLGHKWRSATVASGAFPVNLAQVPAYTFGRFPRHDWLLWSSLKERSWSQPVHYGDYAVTHPALQLGVAFAAPPQVRYALESEWLVIKGRRNDRRGHEQYFDLCSRTVEFDKHGVGNSWGDQAILRASESRGGPGNASTWRAHATSQHLGRVSRQLRAQGDA